MSPSAGLLAALANENRPAGTAALAVGIAAAIGAWLVDRRRRTYTDLPTTPAAAVFAGRNEVEGRAWAPEPLTAHRTSTLSIWWHYRLEEERTHTRTVTRTDSDGHSHSHTETYEQWHEVDEKGDALATFEVVDDTGSVPVRLAGAHVEPRELHQEVFRPEDDRGFLGKLFDNRTGRYRETETAIAVGDRLFVAGDAVLDEATATPVIAGQPLVSTRSEESHTGWLGAGAVVLTLIATAGSAAGVALLVARGDPGPRSIAVGVADAGAGARRGLGGDDLQPPAPPGPEHRARLEPHRRAAPTAPRPRAVARGRRRRPRRPRAVTAGGGEPPPLGGRGHPGPARAERRGDPADRAAEGGAGSGGGVPRAHGRRVVPAAPARAARTPRAASLAAGRSTTTP